MKEITIGENKIGVRATPLALFYYKQEFKADLVSDLLKTVAGMVGVIPNISSKAMSELSVENLQDLNTADLSIDSLAAFNIDIVGLLQMVWAMAKAHEYGRPFPNFETWFVSLGDFNALDFSFLTDVIAEATDGFFRGGHKDKSQEQE